jgi:hypothetical protein
MKARFLWLATSTLIIFATDSTEFDKIYSPGTTIACLVSTDAKYVDAKNEHSLAPRWPPVEPRQRDDSQHRRRKVRLASVIYDWLGHDGASRISSA